MAMLFYLSPTLTDLTKTSHVSFFSSKTFFSPLYKKVPGRHFSNPTDQISCQSMLDGPDLIGRQAYRGGKE